MLLLKYEGMLNPMLFLIYKGMLYPMLLLKYKGKLYPMLLIEYVDDATKYKFTYPGRQGNANPRSRKRSVMLLKTTLSGVNAPPLTTASCSKSIGCDVFSDDL